MPMDRSNLDSARQGLVTTFSVVCFLIAMCLVLVLALFLVAGKDPPTLQRAAQSEPTAMPR